MSEQLHRLISKILESAQFNSLTNAEILNELKEKYNTGANRQRVSSNLRHLTKLNVVISVSRNNKLAWILKKYTKQGMSQNLDKFKNELEFDYTKFIDDWLKQLPRVAMMYGIVKVDDEEQETPYNRVWIEGHSLYNDFKRHVEKLTEDHPDLFLNPFVEQGKFDRTAKSFITERKELIREIAEIVTEEIGNKIYRIYECIEIGHIEIPIELMQGILARLNFGVNWKCSNFSDRWLNDFIQFDSYVEELGEFYGYYLRNLRDKRYFSFTLGDNYVDLIFRGSKDFPKNHFLLKTADRDKQSKEKFQSEMDKRIEEMLRTIGESEQIKEKTVTLYNLQLELHTILNNMKDSLEKIKAIK